ncbi:hypothetical protein EJ08DRAFT_651896 [Tothia fuscella]|uniref:Cytochrome b561 domain-containing protein n=1 Tax=Tothia fuscella TaxID=1048955 RepID=A0A9P4TVI6_9PEZI|nr:hypothetical protein EJ08DRAFT_651896 [Tothia fuscella]
MASATGMPEYAPTEQEPLLGRPGDAAQKEGRPLYDNLVIGTGVVAQAGVWILAAVVWGAIFSHDLIVPFSAHPLLNSAGLVLLAQGALILQPTHTAEQKRQGTYAHAAFNNLAMLSLIAGLVCIEVNKINHNGTHFESPHAIMGLTTYILLIIQAIVGITQYFAPSLYGGVDNAKKIYKYHRVLGYVIFTLMLTTVCAATQTDYNKGVLGIQLWAVIVASVLTLAGVVPRIKKQKLGL